MSSALRSPWLTADPISCLHTAHRHNTALSDAEAEPVHHRRRSEDHTMSMHDVAVGGPTKRLQLCGEYADLGSKLRVMASDTLHSLVLLMSPETWSRIDAHAGGCGSLARNTGAIIGITEAHCCLSQHRDGRISFYLYVTNLIFWGAGDCDIRDHPLPLAGEREFWTRAAPFIHIPVDDTRRQVASALENEAEEENDFIDLDDTFIRNHPPILAGLNSSGRHIGWGDLVLCDRFKFAGVFGEESG